MTVRKIEESYNRVMDLDQVLAFLQETRQVFLHYDAERGVDLWTPQHKMPITLRRAIVKHRQTLLELMRQGDVRVCPDRSLHKSYTRGKRTCGVCRRIQESEVRQSMANTTVPEIAYRHAMEQFVIAGRGLVATVKDCSAERFAGLVRHAITTARNPEKASTDLDGFDYSNRVDRWQAICTLIRHKAKPFWHSSFVDDRMSTQKDNVLL
jgi:hypothetical protein